MAFKEVAEPHRIFIYDTQDEELEDTACSILKDKKLIDAPTKRKFSPYEFFVKKTACSCNTNEIIWNKLENNDNHENDEEDDLWPSPTPKRRKKLIAPAYFTILMGKDSGRETSDNSVQSSIGSSKPDMSEYDDNVNVFKLKKKRLTAPAYQKFLRECNMRAKILREFNKTNNLILMSDA